MNIRRQKERQTGRQDIPTSPDCISREIYVTDNLVKHSPVFQESWIIHINKFILPFLVHSSIF